MSRNAKDKQINVALPPESYDIIVTTVLRAKESIDERISLASFTRDALLHAVEGMTDGSFRPSVPRRIPGRKLEREGQPHHDRNAE